MATSLIRSSTVDQPQRREMKHFVCNGGAASGEDGRLSSQPSPHSQQRSTAKQAKCDCKGNNFTEFTPKKSIHSQIDFHKKSLIEDI